MSAVYIQFVPVEPGEGIAVPIRKWSMSPFEGGVAYAPVTPVTAAAPELLEALKELLAYNSAASRNSARAAIAKATAQ